jgi:NAD-dependent deacetylase
VKTIVIFSGAGLSKESGIPTFRDSLNGLWENFRIEEVASKQGWLHSPRTVLDFYAARWTNIQACQPNAAHFACVQLENKFNVIHVTQNIDDLLERAGAKNIRHLHGQIQYRKCEWHHSISNFRYDPKFSCNYRIKHTSPVQLGELCPICDGQLRPDVVWFGEAVDMQWDFVEDLALSTDVFIGIGTSGQVEPAATLLSVFMSAKEKYFIDPAPMKGIPSYRILQGTACEQLPKLVQQLMNELPD